MKSLKTFIQSKQSFPEVIEEDVITIEELELTDEPLFEDDENSPSHGAMDPPNVLIMRRKSIRQFPNGQRVAMYYVDKINKYVTVPYMAMQWSASMPEGFESSDEIIEENIMNHLSSIVENHSSRNIRFQDGKTMKVDVQTADTVLKVHEALNESNKKKLSDMAYKSKDHFSKVVDFARNNLK